MSYCKVFRERRSLFSVTKTTGIHKLFVQITSDFVAFYLCVLGRNWSMLEILRLSLLSPPMYEPYSHIRRGHVYIDITIHQFTCVYTKCCAPFISWDNKCWQLENLTPQMAFGFTILNENIFSFRPNFITWCYFKDLYTKMFILRILSDPNQNPKFTLFAL